MALNLPKTIRQAQSLVKSGTLTCPQLVEGFFEQMKQKDHLNAYITVRDKNEAIKEAELAQQRYKDGKQISEIDGMPIAIKVQFALCLMIFKGQYSRERLIMYSSFKDIGRILSTSGCDSNKKIEKEWCDYYGSLGMYGFDDKKIVKNPIDEAYFSGGSSSGSAAAIKSNQALAGLGTDTGGSVVFPAHCCGLYSMKPSYGRLSRYGQILYASSNDVIGPMGRTTHDLFTLFDVMQGDDINDSNCIDFEKIKKIRDVRRIRKSEGEVNLKDMRVGVIEEFDIEELDQRNQNVQKLIIEQLKDQGAQIVKVKMPLVKYLLPFYFTLIPSEASSNLARYDGLKYGYQPDFSKSEEQRKTDLFDYIEKARSEAFGINVKRRILIGNFLLSSRFEDFNEKVIEAQKVRRLLIEQYCSVFEKENLDFVISPVCIGEEPPRIEDMLSEKAKKNPVYEYKMDYYTAFANCTGTPAVTIPVQENKQKYKFPTSFKIQGYFGEDYHMLKIANKIEGMLIKHKINEE